MIHRNVPGIGPYVLPAFMLAAIPAIFAAMAYAILSSAMPRAGGSYIYASRGLHPYLGFIASFAQWFGLSIAIGVIGYVIVPFVRDVFVALGMTQISEWLETGWVRVSIALALIWTFILVNLRGLTFYQKIVIPMMVVMFALGLIVIVLGFYFDQTAYLEASNKVIDPSISSNFNWSILLSASALLISSFIGFDSIAQAGGEVKNPSKYLPRAIILCIVIVASFYFLFTASIYHTVPWQIIAQESLVGDLTAPAFFTSLIPSGLTVLIIAGAAIALINDLPAMLLSVSRLVYAWAQDGIFPKSFSRINPKTSIPVNALIVSGLMSSMGVLGSHFAGDFFLGVDIMVTSMLFNFILMCATVIYLPRRNRQLALNISIIKNRVTQLVLAIIGISLLFLYLVMHIAKDIQAELDAWYFHSTIVWIIVMIFGSLIYAWNMRKLNSQGVDTNQLFKQLPSE